MKYSFKFPRKLGKIIYPKGIHDVSEEHVKSKFFEHLLKAGDVSEVKQPAPLKVLKPSPELLAQGNAAAKAAGAVTAQDKAKSEEDAEYAALEAEETEKSAKKKK